MSIPAEKTRAQGLHYRVLRRVGLGDVQGRVGQDLVPAGAEKQSIVPDGPGMLELLFAGVGVEEQVVHLQALLASAKHHLPNR